MADTPGHALRLEVPATSPTQRVSDEEIVAGLLRRETWAAGALYDRVYPAIDRTLRRILRRSDPEHEDLVQLVFEAIIRTLVEKRFYGTCSLPTWAAAIASNIGIDSIRARVRERNLFSRKQVTDPELLQAAGGQRLEQQLLARAEVVRVHGILGRMKPNRAKVLVLHDLLGHDLVEIAATLNMSVSAAQSHLVRGRKEFLRRAKGSRSSG